MRTAKVSVIIPAFNEQEAIGKVVADVPKHLVNEIIVVDNGSTDGTAAAAIKAGASVVTEPQRGYGAACLAGLQAIDDSDIVVFLDGDYSDYPEEMPLLLQPLFERKADLVVGSRLKGTRGKGALPVHSVIGNWLAGKLLYILYGLRLSDLGPFRAIRRPVLEKLELRNRTYGFPIETLTKAARRRYRVVEVPVSYRKRIGTSKITGTVKGSFLASYHILFTVFANALRRKA